jgi:hypothetical protein
MRRRAQISVNALWQRMAGYKTSLPWLAVRICLVTHPKCPLRAGQVPYLERGRINHLASSIGKSYARAMAAVCLLLIVLAMKTNASPIVLNEVHAYVQLQHQIHEALRKEHPEWIQPNGECPMCEAYESRLAELLGLSSESEQRSAA